MVVQGRRQTFSLCDFSSAGNRWASDNRFRTWLPQPLDLGTVYDTGVTWQTMAHGNHRPAPPNHAPRSTSRVERILFLGNSITLCAPAPEVGWTDNWGMAASAAEKDYVHLVVDGLAQRLGKRPEFLAANIADFERRYDQLDLGVQFREQLDFGADVVVVAIGENVPPLDSAEKQAAFRNRFLKLLTTVQNRGRPAIVVRGTFWPEPTRNEILRQCCAAVGGVFVDVAALGQDPSNFAKSERTISHSGVGIHPGDKGMRAIADAILKAMAAAPPQSDAPPTGAGQPH
jgi:lysophospholipase L1-like esterase